MVRYYPLNRVKTDQHTRGDEFLLDGKPYKGYYYTTYDGYIYTGKNPLVGPSRALTSVQDLGNDEVASLTAPSTRATNKPVRSSENTTYTSAAAPTLQQIATFQAPTPYFPKPTDTDYKRKAFMRYFAKKRDRVGFIMEVDKATHDSLQSVDSVYDYITYESISTMWQLVGPLHDDRTNKQYKIAGIIDTNKRLIELKDPGFPGLIDYIGGDYAKFARPTTK